MAASRACAASRLVMLLTDLDAFFNDHRDCGELDGGVDNTGWPASAAQRSPAVLTNVTALDVTG